MKTLIFILIIASFIQTTILSVDLVLLILICRAYIRTDKNNLYLAFGFGILISYLDLRPVGNISIIYLILTELAQTLSKSRLAGNSLLIIPLSFVFLMINQIVNTLLSFDQLQLFPKIVVESLLSLPILYFLRLWEERFIVRKELKLKI
ncbi:hypothetical protein HYW41_03220 [Candidatus Daviesbacteria bacterium]|nr:hypothetical protein [Candidatus Daviesbacteria bacterium]